MKMRKRIMPLVILVAVLLGGYYLYSTGRLSGIEFSAQGESNIISGYIEGDQVDIVPEVGGRIVALAVAEGDAVKAGQEVARLDPTVADAQIKQAAAAIDAANAQLAQIKAGPRAEDVKQAEAAVTQAVAARDAAKQGWDDARAVRDNPQELNARIAGAETQYRTAKFNYDAAVANAQSAATRKDAVGGADNPMTEAKVIVNQWAAAEAAAQTALAALEGAQQNLEILRGLRANPLTANAQVDAAKGQYDSAVAAVSVAEARLASVKAGATAEQINVAQAQVAQAQAALGVLEAQASRLILYSPVDGIVTRKSFHQGEVAAPGSALLTVVRLDPVKLTVYVPETRLGEIKIGMPVSVSVDSFPGKAFPGRVVLIGSEAEFTPRNVQSKEERVNQVFAVQVVLANPDQQLKPGMPADLIMQ